MKRYLLFGGSVFYAAGGWRDFIGSFDSITDAISKVANSDPDDLEWYHVIDSEAGSIVQQSDQQAWS